LTAEVRFDAPGGRAAGLVGRADEGSAEVELRFPRLVDGVLTTLRLAVTAPEESDAHHLARVLAESLSPAGEWTEPDWRVPIATAAVDADRIAALCRPVDQVIREVLAFVANPLPRREEDRP
jgi:hypothetical protein